VREQAATAVRKIIDGLRGTVDLSVIGSDQGAEANTESASLVDQLIAMNGDV
jgi:hypothetical protein